MLTVEDRQALGRMDERLLAVIAQHDHPSMLIAAELAFQSAYGALRAKQVRRAVLQEIDAAIRAGDLRGALRLAGALRQLAELDSKQPAGRPGP
jgi:hypothetical protein